MFSVFIFCQGYERAQNYSLAYCDLRLQVFLHDIVVHHETAADVGDDGVRLMKTEVFVDFDGVKILFVDGEIDCGELFRLTERFDEIERGARQAVFYAMGLAAMLVMSEIVFHVRHFRGLTLLGMALGIGALILPLAFGEWNNGAKNWVSVPLLGSFQPSEIVKLSVVLALAYFFSAHRTVWQMMPALLFAAACLLLLMMQRDLGTALIYYLTTLVLFYVACGNVPLTILGLGGGAGAAVLGYQMFAHVKVRVAMWRNPWSDPTDKGYQIIQALLAIGSGGLFGVGLGQGTPEKIPAYYNDFIFAVVCEQLGQAFGVLLLAVYVLLILRGVTVVARARRSFEMLLGCGVLAMLGIQTFMIVAGVIKMIPLTGVTMPFLSYGGSSLLSCMAMIGILHGASARAQENLEEDILCVRG